MKVCNAAALHVPSSRIPAELLQGGRSEEGVVPGFGAFLWPLLQEGPLEVVRDPRVELGPAEALAALQGHVRLRYGLCRSGLLPLGGA